MKTPKIPRLAGAFLTLAATGLISASSASAAMLAYDGFNYVAGNLAGNTGGTGFSGAWTTTGAGPASNTTIVTPGMTYSSLTTEGSKISLNPTANVATRRTLSSTYATQGSAAVYASVLVNHTAGGRYLGLQFLDSGGTEVAFIGKGSGAANWRATSPTGGPNTFSLDSGVSISGNNPALLVLKIQTLAGSNNDTVSIWVNPSVGGAEPAPTATLTNVNLDPDGFNSIALVAGFFSSPNATSTGFMDEVRIGTDWASVTPIPEPSSALLLGFAGMLLLARARRRKV